jgi:hypothetical protein
VNTLQFDLAISIALSFSLQRYLGEINTAVPAFLAFAQISRPCYPQREVDDLTVGRTKPARRVPVRGRGNPMGFRVLLIVLAFFGDDPGRCVHLHEVEQAVRGGSDSSQLIVDEEIQSDEHGRLKLNGDCEVNKDGGLQQTQIAVSATCTDRSPGNLQAHAKASRHQ